jgi:hypothetical protein
MSDRAMVVGNKIIYAKLKIQENKWMRNRLLSVQSTVDNKIPHSFKPGGPFTRKDGTRRVNLKKMQLKEDRRRLIAQDNAIMLKSISNIMRHNNIDTWASSRKYVPGMSNVGGRRKKLKYIKWENRILLKRLKCTTPWVSNKEMRKDFKRQMLHLKHMGEYAYKGGGKKHGSFDKYWQVAVYEARPIHGKGSKVKRPNTTTGTLSKRRNNMRTRRTYTSQYAQPLHNRLGQTLKPLHQVGNSSIVDRPGTTSSMQHRPGTSTTDINSNINGENSRPESRSRTPIHIPISTWDMAQPPPGNILSLSNLSLSKSESIRLEQLSDLPPLPHSSSLQNSSNNKALALSHRVILPDKEVMHRQGEQNRNKASIQQKQVVRAKKDFGVKEAKKCKVLNLQRRN